MHCRHKEMKTNGYILVCFLMIISMSQPGCEKDDHSIVTEVSDPVTDIDGNVYGTIIIGDQRWMVENLNVTHFRNGDPIPEAKTVEEWIQAGNEQKPAWCSYNNDPDNASEYGKLYNWYAVNDPRGLEPEGWHTPTTREWAELIDYLGGDDIAGATMKSLTGWPAGDNGDNTSGFQALPGGGRISNGDFSDIDNAAVWWSSSENTGSTGYAYNIINADSRILRGTFNKPTGLSVRSVYCPDCNNDTISGLTFYERLQVALDVSLNSGLGKGISAAVIMPGGEIWTGVSGISHGTTPITPDMLFAIGSAQKMFSGVTILQLEEEGKISVDDSLYKWLPPYQYVDSTINISQLLNHTSGLYHFVDYDEYWQEIFDNPGRVWTMEEMFLNFNREPLFPKGTSWHYCQTGYNMIRMIIKDITGSDIPEVNEERFWTPLDLKNTITSREGELPDLYAHSWYDLDGDGSYDYFASFDRTAFVTGIGGEVWSTAEDLAKWARALFHDKTVLTQASLDKMLTFHSPCIGEEFVCAGYGLSVVNYNTDVTNGIQAIGHSGNAPGYAAACIYFPDYNVCIGAGDNTEEGETIGAGIINLLKVITDSLQVKH